MIVASAFVLGLVLTLVKVRRARHSRQLLESPLPGLDTGTRSPYRVPRRVRFHKGF